MIDVDEIKKEVALKNGVLLNDDDPVMIIATMVEVVVRQCITEMQSQNELYRTQMLNAVQYSNEETKAAAAKIISDSADYAANQIREAVVVIIRAGLAKNQDALHEVHVARTTAVGAALFSIGSAIATGFLKFWN